ncbi:MAG: hypothetical protein A2Y17_12030 [Clostridiales bacterium GWF2_38_85]|nr:MAG: hypothetical protein A2Y17_12030 [Clostridiales bacterium GWF2_38_85]HBL85429.1 hypothetical protein [Clostridiales bacterium]
MFEFDGANTTQWQTPERQDSDSFSSERCTESNTVSHEKLYINYSLSEIKKATGVSKSTIYWYRYTRK